MPFGVRPQGLLALLLAWTALAAGRTAFAEKTLASGDGWEMYSDGRLGVFVNEVYGQGYPVPTYGVDASGNFVPTPIFTALGGGFSGVTQQGMITDPSLNIPPGLALPNQGTINTMSVRSGFVGTLLGVGMRGAVTATTSANVYFQLWAFVESAYPVANSVNYPEARQGYAELRGPWGSFLVGRTRALFSRGVSDIEVLYRGPTQIDRVFQAGNFAPGLIYATPSWHGLQLSVGAFDPLVLDNGGWFRTKYLRPEAELTYERRFGDGGWGKLVLFVDGGYQKVYESGTCTPSVDALTGEVLPCEQTMAGVASGGRLEIGRVRIGAAGYLQRGLGLSDPIEIENASQDPAGILRLFGGAYLQGEVKFRAFDLFAGGGIVRMYPTEYDRLNTVQDPRDPLNPLAQVHPFSVIESQTELNGGIVYHATSMVHVDIDLFRKQANWTPVNGYPGPTQRIYIGNCGLTIDW